MIVIRWLVALGWLGTWWLCLGFPAFAVALASRPTPRIERPVVDEVVERDGRATIGRCYRERIGAITHLHLEGDPTTIGWCHGALGEEALGRLEREMVEVFVDRAPSFLARHLILGFVHWNNRDLDSYFTPPELAEIAAVSSGHRQHEDPFAAMSPGYQRSLHYHALHDISQYLIDNPLIHAPQVGCTAVAVANARSAEGHLLVGRLFDFEGGRAFDLDKVVITCRPDHGIPFVSVVWNGMAGAVTGLNEAGLWISINAAASDQMRFIGRPMVMVVREVLQTCRTLDEAVQVIEKADVFVSNTILLASRDENRAICVENGPAGCAVRPMRDDVLVTTNHFLDPSWADDEANAGRIANGTTARRFDRASALIAATPVHDPATILALLRDRGGEGGADVGFGNRSTINAWIGAHLVVCDVTAGVLWVCEPSHGLGRAMPFTVAGPLQPGPILPASPDFALHERAGDEALRLEREIEAQVAAGRRGEAAATVPRLLELNPNSFHAHVLAARACDDAVERRRLLERALTLQPAYAADRREIEAMLGER